jgi:hypothetical protein
MKSDKIHYRNYFLLERVVQYMYLSTEATVSGYGRAPVEYHGDHDGDSQW